MSHHAGWRLSSLITLVVLLHHAVRLTRQPDVPSRHWSTYVNGLLVLFFALVVCLRPGGRDSANCRATNDDLTLRCAERQSRGTIFPHGRAIRVLHGYLPKSRPRDSSSAAAPVRRGCRLKKSLERNCVSNEGLPNPNWPRSSASRARRSTLSRNPRRRWRRRWPKRSARASRRLSTWDPNARNDSSDR